MRILFLSTASPFDRNSWSGITCQIYRQLEKSHTLQWSGKPTFNIWQRFRAKLWRTQNLLLKKKYTDQNIFYSRILCDWAMGLLEKIEVDLIIVASGEPELIAYLQTTIPIVYIADSTFNLKVDYYPWHTDLSSEFITEGEIVESRAIALSNIIIYSSQWAAESAIKRYGAKQEKVFVQPFGPNINNSDSMSPRSVGQMCNLLFIGKDWKRKGGNVALYVFRELKRFFPCTLTVIGCDPGLPPEQGLSIFPLLDKSKKADSDTYDEILMRSDILLLPTFADCTPVVFSEAAAFGIPVVSRQTGGVDSIVVDGETGFCLPYAASGNEFFKSVYELWCDQNKYQAMSLSAVERYKSVLNWEKWSELFSDIIE